ncbi:MAG: site-specific integrase [Bdellovibrionaceae bacterium]|nr:site-specific integrase [Pseudobdellovibrionaceae bacterium]
MGIKYNNQTKSWDVSYSKRHPVTRKPVTLRRSTIRDQFGVHLIKTKSESKMIYHELERLVHEKFHRSIIPTWSAIVEAYLEDKRLEWTNKTHLNAKYILNAYTIHQWGERTVESITSIEIKKFILETLSEKSVTTRQSIIKFIRGAFQYAVEAGHLKGNPSPTIRLKLNSKIKMVLTEGQVRFFLDQAKYLNPEWYPLWATAVYTGMRNGELFALTWDKVNFDNRSILVDTSWTKADGFKSTKSGDDRIVEIAPPLLQILKELKLETYESGFVLPRCRNWEKGEQARILRMFLQGLGLPSIRFHDLRATWATIMLSKGVEPIKVMSMGGWKALKTMQIYIRKAGVDIQGITDGLYLHSPEKRSADVLTLKK